MLSSEKLSENQNILVSDGLLGGLLKPFEVKVVIQSFRAVMVIMSTPFASFPARLLMYQPLQGNLTTISKFNVVVPIQLGKMSKMLQTHVIISVVFSVHQ